jgi:hypothetical protein
MIDLRDSLACVLRHLTKARKKANQRKITIPKQGCSEGVEHAFDAGLGEGSWPLSQRL